MDKIIGAVAYVASWLVLGIRIFHPVPLGIMSISIIVVAFMTAGAFVSWLATAADKASQTATRIPSQRGKRRNGSDPFDMLDRH